MAKEITPTLNLVTHTQITEVYFNHDENKCVLNMDALLIQSKLFYVASL